MKFSDLINHLEENIYSALFYTPPYFKKSYSYLFTDPFEIIQVKNKKELDLALHFLDEFSAKKAKGFCLINYEAGYLFESKLNNKFNPSDNKIFQLFFFDDNKITKIKSSKIEFDLTQKNQFNVSSFKLNTSKQKFLSDIKKIKKQINLGNTYQVNYTIKGRFGFTGSLSAFIEELIFNQTAEYSAFINTGENFVLSFSPELFLSIKGNNIKSVPMKGTAKRGIELNSDQSNQYSLQKSEKDRAENVMIVDLIRNDLGKICRTGSVLVPELFSVKPLESLFQMTSTITGKLNKNVPLSEVLRCVFPCGSVTGAPKISTMEIINILEAEERGIYTGSIGLFMRNKKIFNVAIRTITLDKQKGTGELGLGSGIVLDSNPEEEYKEIMLKSEFLTNRTEYFELFETMKIENGKIIFSEEHINRLKTACSFFLFRFNEKKVRKYLDKLSSQYSKGFFRVRLNIDKWGNLKTEVNAYQYLPSEIRIIVSAERINPQNKYQYFKTTNRKLYENEYSEYSSRGFFDVLFLNKREEVAEGSFTNIFLRKSDQWFTSPVSSGILPGIYRSFFMKSNSWIQEKILHINDLYDADEIILTNSLRGEIKVDSIYFDKTEFKSFD